MPKVKRCDKVAFFGVKDSSGKYVFHRMKNFTEISTSKNPQEYSRQYVDEEMVQTDIVGYSPSISYNFDMYSGNAVHEDIASITDNEYVGDDAVRPIVMVDITKQENNAVVRNFSVVPDTEGDTTEAYTYGGVLKVKGEKSFGTASSTDNWLTCTFAE